jgi:predicted permease
MAVISGAPKNFHCASMAAVAFANSTGLPLTLIAIVYSSMPRDSGMGRVNPAIFISIYLTVYPVLQWGIGGWLLEPPEEPSECVRTRNVMHGKRIEVPFETELRYELVSMRNGTFDGFKFGSPSSLEDSLVDTPGDLAENAIFSQIGLDSELNDHPPAPCPKRSIVVDCLVVCDKVVSQLAQPAIIASLAGLTIALIPSLHNVMTDVADRDGDAPLEWLFDGMYTMGQAAIPNNMILLGSTLSQGVKSIPSDFRWGPNLAVAFGKMVVIPVIGIFSVLLLDSILYIKPQIKSSLYFAMLVVTSSPTANNINVMAEIGGINKDTMALCLLTQYVMAPVLLTFWVAVFLWFAKLFSEST